MDCGEQGEKIDVVFNNTLIEHLYFNYIGWNERQEIMKRLAFKQSVVCAFKQNDEILFVCVLDFENVEKILNVRQVGGYFGRIHDVLDLFTEQFARAFGFDFVTFETEKRAVKKWAEKSGFELLDNGQFQKVIH